MELSPKQKYSLLSKMGYTGSLQGDEMDAFLQSNPGAAARMGKFDKALKRGFQIGGLLGTADATKAIFSATANSLNESGETTGQPDMSQYTQASAENEKVFAQADKARQDYLDKVEKLNEAQAEAQGWAVAEIESK